MIDKTHYEILGINHDSSIDDIHLSFKQLINKNSKISGKLSYQEFNEIILAYDVLSCHETKMKYDRDINNEIVNKKDVFVFDLNI
ncbi:DnaJ domain-containing protein [Vibrio sp. SS-MA-C1-2]|uniref:DnaJ domain-containing protein n=1 Tax=Vibrio sp. SS-MA-C1-2 TaxID=2908646 RepID=UPI001F2B0876|nr:DnaJ domain-containing protein [Vibrio sp. SS-MA-C1-2]UJF16996.1 DnaJ domain-containing protein [Vibrio sp. SS-MA-C1-2]